MKNQRLSFKNLNIFLILILPIIFFAFGVKKQNELYEKLTIQGVGIDFDNNKYKVTVQAYDYKNPKDKNEPKIRTLECTGETVSEAMESLKNSTGLYPFYSQNKVIVFGSSLAKNGLKNSIDFFTRYYENRPSVKLRVAKNTASEIFKSKVDDKEIKASEIRDLVDENSDTNILKFEENIRSSISDSILMMLEKDENGVVCNKAMILKNDKIIDNLDVSETIGAKILRNSPKIGIYTFSYENKKISCNLENSKSKIKVSIKDNIPEFAFDIKVDSNLFESEQGDDQISYIDKVRAKLNENLKELCEKVISKTVSQGCDLFNLGKILRNKFPKYFKYIEPQWKDKILPKISYNLNVEAKITMIGL